MNDNPSQSPLTSDIRPRKFTDGHRPKVSLLIPVYNEESVMPLLFSRVNALLGSHDEYDWEVLLVNDGSRDSSLLLAMQFHACDPRWHYLDLSRNFGKEIAMMAGLDYVTGDCVVIMDADLQHPPETIPGMLACWMEGYDDIYGRRRSRGKEPWLRKVLSMQYYRLLQKSSKMEVLQNVGDFRCLDRICIDALRRLRETQRYGKGLFCWIGFRKKEFVFDQDDRPAGSSKWNFHSLLNLAVDGITSYTTAPLRLATVSGFMVSAFAFIYMIYFLVKTIMIGDDVQGFPTIIIVMLFLGGVILLCLGIIGEYVGRIFAETKNRPAYFVRDYDGQNPKQRHEKID